MPDSSSSSSSIRLPVGTQILYVPSHLDKVFARMVAVNRIEYAYPNGVQPGFIVSAQNRSDPLDNYYCRYWLIEDGQPIHELRTKANSELTPGWLIEPFNSVPQHWVDEALHSLEKGG